MQHLQHHTAAAARLTVIVNGTRELLWCEHGRPGGAVLAGTGTGRRWAARSRQKGPRQALGDMPGWLLVCWHYVGIMMAGGPSSPMGKATRAAHPSVLRAPAM